jgi:hypothetical protein
MKSLLLAVLGVLVLLKLVASTASAGDCAVAVKTEPPEPPRAFTKLIDCPRSMEETSPDLVAGQALQFITGHVTFLESTYMPGWFVLKMDEADAANVCPPDTLLKWTNPKSAQATYASALAALTSGKIVNFVVKENDATCTGQFFHVTWR